MIMKSIDLTSATWGDIKNESYRIALLPWGAIEPHNYHMPYMTDCYLSYHIALDCAEKVREKNIQCMVLPPVYFGSQNPGQWNKPFCIHTRTETQKAILTDIITSLHTQGFRKMVIVNGHGGNTFKPFVRDLAMLFPDFQLIVVDWWQVVPTEGYFEEKPDEHAGEQETSVLMHYRPDLVQLNTAGDGAVAPCRISGVDKKIGWMPRHWDEVSADTGIGNPHKSSAEKGKRYADAVVAKISELLIELAQV